MTQNWKKLNEIQTNKLTPMLRQYLEAKTGSGDSLLFFRMGDFYELFFDDALEAAELLGIALTSRDAVTKDERIPMAGVPVRSVDGYIARCLKAGRTVAICEQIEDPRDAKGIVRRAIVRTITPGTLIETDLLDETANNYLAALILRSDNAGLAFLDVTTGEFLAAQFQNAPERALIDELTRMAPAEILVTSLDAPPIESLRASFDGTRFTPWPEHEFDPEHAHNILCEHFGLGTLKGVGLDDTPEARSAAGAALAYVQSTQKDAAPTLQLPRRYTPSHFVVIDGNSQRNLELTESMAGKGKKGTLLAVLDRTLTSMGGRKLRQWLLHPLVDLPAIHQRLEAVQWLYENTDSRLQLRDGLRGVADLERLTGRITAKASNPRELRALASSLKRIPAIHEAIANADASLILELRQAMDPLHDVADAITSAITDEPPLSITEGNLIRDGYNSELDRLRALVRGGRDWIASLQKDEAARTGISNLRVGYNKVFGYYIEVSRGQTHLVPPDYERKQTLVNAERYVSALLKSREEEIVSAQERMEKLEYDLFRALREQVAAQARRIQSSASAIASIDALWSLADAASAYGYVKPIVHNDDEIYIRDGRHPVVERITARATFVPNDAILGGSGPRLLIVTGPNMAGKSTYLRQVALITLMAQAGSFVPAAEARIGLVDRIYTRVGAGDNLARGESTFMVEMIEAANILNTATRQSLIIIDEIGRGTSTFDGISIAWAVAEHIHNTIQAKTLFATHYHELTELGSKLDSAKNINVAVREWAGKVIFLYRITDGGADHSYGIQVAKLAGLPNPIIKRAREILESLESGTPASSGLPQQLYLFGPATQPQTSPVEQELRAIDPDHLSPRQAHEFLYHLRQLLDKKK